MDVTEEPLPQHDVDLGGALTQGISGLLSAADQTGLAGIHGGGHDRAQALIDTDGSTGDDGVADIVHLVGDHGNGVVDRVFSKDFRVVGSGGDGLLQNPLADIS